MTALRLPRLPVWILAAWLAALGGETGIHLAHHLLDEDEGADCGFLAAADHAPGHLDAPPVLPGLARLTERPSPLDPVSPVSSVAPNPSTRAPPSTPPAALR